MSDSREWGFRCLVNFGGQALETVLAYLLHGAVDFDRSISKRFYSYGRLRPHSNHMDEGLLWLGCRHSRHILGFGAEYGDVLLGWYFVVKFAHRFCFGLFLSELYSILAFRFAQGKSILYTIEAHWDYLFLSVGQSGLFLSHRIWYTRLTTSPIVTI